MKQHAFRILGLDTSFEMTNTNPPKVNIRLADLLPLLIDATQRNRAWIKDFDDEQITVSQDLYEVALAYRSMGRAA